MTNEELLEGIATALLFSGGEQTKEQILEQAQAVIDHLAPMMKEVVVALGAVVPDSRKTANVLSSLPECWKGGVICQN
jgi:hypothetical protein